MATGDKKVPRLYVSTTITPLTEGKVTDISCIANDFRKFFDILIAKSMVKGCS